MTRIVLLTGSELRHQFVRKRIAANPGIDVLRSYCEGTEKSLATLAHSKTPGTAERELAHLRARERTEEDFFRDFVDCVDDRSRPVSIPKGEVNSPEVFDEISSLAPDLLVAYGCSIVKEPLLGRFAPRFLNVHLGLSPYYRGAGTNFWPFVNGEPEYAGITFMYIDAGVDTGEIIHQIRPRIYPGDTFHVIGNRLISDMARVYADIVVRYDDLVRVPQIPVPADEKVYKRKDFTDGAVELLLGRLQGGLIETYLREREERCRKVLIVENPALLGAAHRGDGR